MKTVEFTHSLAFPCPDVRPCHGILVNISGFLTMPDFSNRAAGAFEHWRPWGPFNLRSREGRRGGFPRIARPYSYLYSTASPHPTPQAGPHYPVPTFQENPLANSLQAASPATRLGPGGSLGLDHLPAPPCLQGPLWAAPGHLPVVQVFSKCPHQWHLLLGAQAA